MKQKLHWPDRVWYPTEKGWALRPATKEDRTRRREVEKRLAGRAAA